MKLKLAFYKSNTGTPIDKFMSEFLDYKYSHVGIIIEEYGNESYYCTSASKFSGDVGLSHLHLRSKNYDIFEVPIHTSEDSIYNHYNKYAGLKYDYLGEITRKFRIVPCNKDKMYSSEYVASFLGYNRPHLYSVDDIYYKILGLKSLQIN